MHTHNPWSLRIENQYYPVISGQGSWAYSQDLDFCLTIIVPECYQWSHVTATLCYESAPYVMGMLCEQTWSPYDRGWQVRVSINFSSCLAAIASQHFNHQPWSHIARKLWSAYQISINQNMNTDTPVRWWIQRECSHWATWCELVAALGIEWYLHFNKGEPVCQIGHLDSQTPLPIPEAQCFDGHWENVVTQWVVRDTGYEKYATGMVNLSNINCGQLICVHHEYWIVEKVSWSWSWPGWLGHRINCRVVDKPKAPYRSVHSTGLGMQTMQIAQMDAAGRYTAYLSFDNAACTPALHQLSAFSGTDYGAHIPWHQGIQAVMMPCQDTLPVYLGSYSNVGLPLTRDEPHVHQWLVPDGHIFRMNDTEDAERIFWADPQGGQSIALESGAEGAKNIIEANQGHFQADIAQTTGLTTTETGMRCEEKALCFETITLNSGENIEEMETQTINAEQLNEVSDNIGVDTQDEIQVDYRQARLESQALTLSKVEQYESMGHQYTQLASKKISMQMKKAGIQLTGSGCKMTAALINIKASQVEIWGMPLGLKK